MIAAEGNRELTIHLFIEDVFQPGMKRRKGWTLAACDYLSRQEESHPFQILFIPGIYCLALSTHGQCLLGHYSLPMGSSPKRRISEMQLPVDTLWIYPVSQEIFTG